MLLTCPLFAVERQRVLEDKKRETKAWFEQYFRNLLRVPATQQAEDLEITKKDFLRLLHNKDVSSVLQKVIDLSVADGVFVYGLFEVCKCPFQPQGFPIYFSETMHTLL